MKSFGITAAVLIMVAVVLCAGAVAGEKTYKASDLKGTYSFITNQIRMEPPPGGGDPQVNYCSGYGTITFDGVSMMTGESTDRCSLTGTTVETIAQTYEVDADGTFIVTETAFPYYSTHCKIADRGRTLLCDGTASGSDILSFSAVAGRD